MYRRINYLAYNNREVNPLFLQWHGHHLTKLRTNRDLSTEEVKRQGALYAREKSKLGAKGILPEVE